MPTIYTDDKYLYKVSELSEITGITINDINDLINKGLIKTMVIGSRRITKKSFIDFLEENDGKDLSMYLTRNRHKISNFEGR